MVKLSEKEAIKKLIQKTTNVDLIEGALAAVHIHANNLTQHFTVEASSLHIEENIVEISEGDIEIVIDLQNDGEYYFDTEEEEFRYSTNKKDWIEVVVNFI